MRRARRSMSLLELVVGFGALATLMGLLHGALNLAIRWRATTQEVARTVVHGELLRLRLRESIRQGRPIDALSLTAQGHLVEGEVAQAAQRWIKGESFVLRGGDAYWVFQRRGKHLVRHRLGFDGRVTRSTITRGVRSAQFTTQRDERGRFQGVAYVVTFLRGPKSQGFVGARAAPPDGRTPPAPVLASPWKRGGTR